jgi:hypothetical protein
MEDDIDDESASNPFSFHTFVREREQNQSIQETRHVPSIPEDFLPDFLPAAAEASVSPSATPVTDGQWSAQHGHCPTCASRGLQYWMELAQRLQQQLDEREEQSTQSHRQIQLLQYQLEKEREERQEIEVRLTADRNDWQRKYREIRARVHSLAQGAEAELLPKLKHGIQTLRDLR